MYDKPWQDLSHEERERVAMAIHEAGHVVVGKALNMKIVRATLRPGAFTGSGHVILACRGRDNYKHLCVAALAGGVAFRLLFNAEDEAAGVDQTQAEDFARKALAERGTDTAPAAVSNFLKLAGMMAEDILRRNVAQLQRVHLELLKNA